MWEVDEQEGVGAGVGSGFGGAGMGHATPLACAHCRHRCVPHFIVTHLVFVFANLLGQDLGGFDETESTCPGPSLVPSPVRVPVPGSAPGPGLKVFRVEGAASPFSVRASPMLRSASTGGTLCSSRTSSDEAGPPTTPVGAQGQAHMDSGICTHMQYMQACKYRVLQVCYTYTYWSG